MSTRRPSVENFADGVAAHERADGASELADRHAEVSRATAIGHDLQLGTTDLIVRRDVRSDPALLELGLEHVRGFDERVPVGAADCEVNR